MVSFAVFAYYAYRDIWPLMTFTLRPADEAEGPLLWIKVGLAIWAGLLGPLVEPYSYIPLHPEVRLFDYLYWLTTYLSTQDPTANPNPEQTASVLAWIFYAFLDPLIWRAYDLPHLSHDQLPPLADYDEAHYLIEQNYKVCCHTVLIQTFM